ncbi:hypothetical protein MLD38_035252 [Melastoma candidum]|uniref:Uncharacterized protein n=1 Tax=Melastoma candidum TaxID=119954 RepID=A0ACB9MC93_9MYRT|nr:hypothetical protein MLD38_035252 [Melastoma candidum]
MGTGWGVLGVGKRPEEGWEIGNRGADVCSQDLGVCWSRHGAAGVRGRREAPECPPPGRVRCGSAGTELGVRFHWFEAGLVHCFRTAGSLLWGGREYRADVGTKLMMVAGSVGCGLPGFEEDRGGSRCGFAAEMSGRCWMRSAGHGCHGMLDREGNGPR